MRIRSLTAAFAAAVLLVGVGAVPASAGTGASQACLDGVGWNFNGLSSPVTVAYEIQNPPDWNVQHIWICYSTTSYGQPNALVGGAIRLDVHYDTGLAYPGAYVALQCLPDSGVSVGPVVCSYANSANVAPFDVSASVQGPACLVWLNGLCLLQIPGVRIATNDTGYPLLAITVANVHVPADLPPQCLGVAYYC